MEVLEYMDSRFSKPLKTLIYLGAWAPDINTKDSHKTLFSAYCFMWNMILVTFFCFQIVHLYLVFGDFKEMTFNFCSSTTVLCVIVALTFFRKTKSTNTIKSLHYNLWRDSMCCNNGEDMAKLNAAFHVMSVTRKFLYSGPLVTVPIWATYSYFSYKWETRILPFAVHFPMSDVNNDVVFVPVLIYEIIMAYYVTLMIIEIDSMVLSVVLQIKAHYQILGSKLIQLNEETKLARNHAKGEINKFLKSDGIVRKLKAIIKRHLELLKYCEDTEDVFNLFTALQVFGGSFILLMNAIELTRRVTDLSFSLFCQMMYVIFVMIDLYIICYHYTTLAAEGVDFGHKAYGSKWYELDKRAKRMLCLIIVRAQKSSRFTYGKLFVVNLNAFMQIIKNIYSCLMLLRQLEMK